MRYAAIALLVILLTGCGSVPVKNRLQAKLMPESIATKKVLERYFPQDWVNSPYGYHFATYCGDNGKDDLPFNEINVVRIFNEGKRIQLHKMNWLLVAVPCHNMWVWWDLQTPLTDQDVNDIVDALVSLGANIDEVSD